MINFEISPAAFEFLDFKVSYYFLVYILGFFLVLYFVLKAAEKKEINMRKEQVYDLAILSVLGIIIGARVFHVLFWNFDYYTENILRIFYLWEGGFSFHGGLMGGILVLFFYTKYKKIDVLKLLDVAIVPVVLVLAFGRIANFLNGENLGIATNVPWCVVFENAEGCRHPTQLYAALGRVGLFFLLLFIKTMKKYKEGFLFWNFVLFSGIGRFFLDFFVEKEEYFFLGVGQWFSLAMMIAGIYFISKHYEKNLNNLFKKVAR